ncbi:ATP-dependent nuclease [Pseudomarimonas salicorniae]|uniref:ATP-binding protein n=1 Tax=Pseudomarimonas salicorniae TaxID=2933270 RepID=A0ABT0GEG3_9GAMM|nr:AAA family ATPase [Lysobacter sp. CAU 1642]MCK7592921.1 ATP-binding protein [Lysobacter sp. CAU 1642]
MKIEAIRIRNFRTIEDLSLKFPDSYTAICGPNDSGKTNVLRALRAIMRDNDDAHYYPGEEDGISVKDDYPKWLETPSEERETEISIELLVHHESDAGLYQFLVRQLQLETNSTPLALSLKASYRTERSTPSVSVICRSSTYEGIEAQEVFKRLQTSRSILFHDSPQNELTRFRYKEGLGSLRDLSGEGAKNLEKLKKQLEKGLGKIARGHQQELERLLGRLENKYKVGLTIPPMELGWLPLNLTLGDSKHDVPLDNWGSGTQNRTLILHRLFRAKQISELEASASKLTPLIVIEEPESFLHPYAQAEFGRVLQDLSEEFQIQVLVTTHSPYLLSQTNPSSNALLSRKTHYGALRATQRVDSSGDNWMAPFGQALGMSSDEFKPWKALFGSQSESVLLVEGETDREYFEMLRDPAHANNSLQFVGDIIPYDGVGTLKNTILLRFIRSRYERLFITFDLDMRSDVERSLSSLGLKKDVDFLPIGTDSAGKRAIEGLLPESVHRTVFSENPSIVMAATSGTREERESARNQLKRKCLEAFKLTAKPGPEHFGGFYKVVKTINAALKRPPQQ